MQFIKLVKFFSFLCLLSIIGGKVKRYTIYIRANEELIKKIEKLCEILKLTRSRLVAYAINRLYRELVGGEGEEV